ncbi:MAG: pseudouridine synthase [Cyanophyceae cyanobacterium]
MASNSSSPSNSSSAPSKVRLQKLLSQWGIASRRRSEGLIREGRVTVNGQRAKVGDGADPKQDLVAVDGEPLRQSARPRDTYLLINKPRGVLCACTDDRQRPVILDLLPRRWQTDLGLHPVGRLDFNSTGALLLTNDGDFTYRLTHPRFHVSKYYRVVVVGRPSSQALGQWRKGVMLDNRRTLPAQVEICAHPSKNTTELAVTLIEGRNRQIRRVAELLGHPVRSLHREAIGPLTLQGDLETETSALRSGEYRHLSSGEINFLKEQIGIVSS